MSLYNMINQPQQLDSTQALSHLKDTLGVPNPSLKEVLGIPDRLKQTLGVGQPLNVDHSLFTPKSTPEKPKKPSIMDKLKRLKDRILKK